MAIPTRATISTTTAGLHWQITDDGSRTLWVEDLNETYHSGCGAVAESLVVYLRNSGVHERLSGGLKTSVLEYGFGTATSFLLTAADAINHQTQLYYRALELSLLPSGILSELKLTDSKIGSAYQGEFSNCVSVAQELLEELVFWRGTLPVKVCPGKYRCVFRECVFLEVIVGDAVNYKADDTGFHAVYFDPFSPTSCPELWKPPIFRVAFQSLCKGGKLVSYCVKSIVRREFAEVGFDVKRIQGPIGGKREVLLATK